MLLRMYYPERDVLPKVQYTLHQRCTVPFTKGVLHPYTRVLYSIYYSQSVIRSEDNYSLYTKKCTTWGFHPLLCTLDCQQTAWKCLSCKL